MSGKARILKVGRTHQCRASGATVRVPLIRLSGLWLAGAGFAEGDSVNVQVTAGVVTITREGVPVGVVAEQPELFG